MQFCSVLKDNKNCSFHTEIGNDHMWYFSDTIFISFDRVHIAFAFGPYQNSRKFVNSLRSIADFTFSFEELYVLCARCSRALSSYLPVFWLCTHRLFFIVFINCQKKREIVWKHGPHRSFFLYILSSKNY